MIESAFIMPLFYEKISTLNNLKLKEYALKLKSESPGRIASNFGGWQSDSIEERVDELSDRADVITDRCNQFHLSMGFKSTFVHRITNMWININSQGNMNHPHVHPGSALSGVYYVDCHPDSGKIVFTNPNAYFCNEDTIETYTPVTSGKYFQIPEVSKIVIFPAYMSHYVEPNLNKEDRISISFNTLLYRTDTY